jgi:hypothetical protein
MNRTTAIIALAVFVAALAHAGMPTPEDPAAPTYQELMAPEMFPDPQRGMAVESAELDGGTVRIRTTGADIAMDLAKGEVRFKQRIGHERDLATLRLGTALSRAKVTHSGPGFARVTFEQPAMTVRVNGDSLFMLHVHEAGAVSVDRRIHAAWNASYLTSHLIADEWGAFGLYCSETALDDHYDALDETVARYALPADAVLWVGVCPPKPYDWEKSFKENVVWHWSNETSYPPSDTLKSWHDHGNIVLLQAEMMLWKDWNLEFIPRLGEAEFARVRDAIHDAGMRFIVYTSPYYFLKGTALEPRAINTFEGFKGWPPGTPTGENMGLFLPQIRRVMAEYKPDGLYFDGQYTNNPAALYALARESRNIVGEDGILEWHSTFALGPNRCSLPHADAYVDFILRGEGRKSAYADFDYLRFFVSGYNIHNSIGVLCNNGPVGVTPELAGDVLKANGRFHTIVSWLDKPDTMKALRENYEAHLTPDLRPEVEEQIDARQALVAQKVAALEAERDALEAPPAWGKPAFVQRFDAMPDASQSVSPQNDKPFSVRDGALCVRAHANTYAFLRIPVSAEAAGFVVKLRQGTDGGQSWGPGAMLRWESGAGLRLGTRSDGTLQSDILGSQQHGGTYDAATWVWLRVRWVDGTGVVERSADGVAYERLWTFEHGGALKGQTAELLVGKVPFNGAPADYSLPGDVGECEIAFVEVYAPYLASR